MKTRIRRAQPQDLYLTFRWFNDPLTRRMSFQPEFVSIANHSAWFESFLNNSGTTLLIAENYNDGKWNAMGQFRIDSDGVVSLGLDFKYRGKHLASLVLQTALDNLPTMWLGRKLFAYIKPTNQASVKTFAGCGFALVRKTFVKGSPCTLWTCVIS